MKRILNMAGSRSLTVWILTTGIVYYLTVAVWGEEAFSSIMSNLRSNPIFITVAAMLFVNITVRGVMAVIGLRESKTKLFLRLPLIAGMIIFFIAFFMSNVFREFQWKLVGVDDVLKFGKNRVLRVVHIDPALKKNVLLIKGEGGIFSYEPIIKFRDPDGIQYDVGAYPPARVKGLYMHVLQFGLGPGIELIENKTVIAKGYMALRLLPFGSMDGFEIPPYPYRFDLTIRPDRTIRKGNNIAYHYDIEKPRYNVVITKGNKRIAEKETDSGINFNGDMHLNFFRPKDWIMVEIVKDPFLQYFVVGLGLLLAGIILYPFSFLVGGAKDSASVVDRGQL